MKKSWFLIIFRKNKRVLESLVYFGTLKKYPLRDYPLKRLFLDNSESWDDE